MTSATELQRLIGIVEAKFAGLPEVEPDRWASYSEHRDAATAALDELVQAEGARWRRSGDATTLALFGIRSSATGGESAAMRNWLTAARKKLGEVAS